MAQQYMLDRYRVIEKAGAGGYGSVYHAFDTHLKRDVAIKCIELSEADVARARILATEERMREDLGEVPFDEDILAGAFDEDDFPEDPSFLNLRDGMPAQQIGVIGAAAETAAMPKGPSGDEDPFDHIPGLKEARMVAHLSDASIVGVHECIVEDNCAYIIMEYVEGKTLAQIMRESDEPLSLDAVAAVVSKVAQALSVAHEGGVLHLDIKPDNVLINAKGQVKVTDFGLATLADANGRATTGGGTIGYMPLEQMRLEPLDARTDQWALGALTYEMLTDENPFRTESLKEAQQLIEESELVLPSLCWDELSPEADDIVFCAMDLEPDARFTSVNAFSKALLPHLGNPKEGQKELARLVKGVQPAPVEEGDDLAVSESSEPKQPLIDRLGPRGSSVLVRVIAGAGSALTCAIGLANIHLVEGSALGLASDMMPAFAAIVVLCAVLSLIKPHIGALVSLIVLSVAIFANGGYVLGLAFLVICSAWWYLIGRHGNALATVPLLVPLFGSLGLAAIAPIAGGALLSVGRAAVTALFCAFLALTFASFGSGDVMGWNVLNGLAFSSSDLQATFIVALLEPRTWCILVSWIAAAAAFSVLCLRGTKAFDVIGGVIAAGILLFGVLAGFGLDIFGSTWRPGLLDFAGALIPGIAAIAIAASNIADRARWEKDEWASYLRGPETPEA